jgi:squalene synthase HpnC
MMLPMSVLDTPVNSVQHYENFPVASLLLPKHAVPAVQALYRFARGADDIADEGTAPHHERLQALDELALQLESPHTADQALVHDLAPFIAQGKLPVVYLQQLLSAFRQDVLQDASSEDVRFATMAALLDYCSRSANPVGRLMLHCVGAPCTASSFAASDAICTSLQLINFWQDLAKDAANNRVYIPQDMFSQFGNPSSPKHAGYVPMMAALCLDARQRMVLGTPLLGQLQGRFKAEIALTMSGGLRILDKLAAVNYDVIHHRPQLGWRDAPACLGMVFALYRGNTGKRLK